MHSFNKGTGKVEVQLKWDPSPLGAPDSDLDIIAATYTTGDTHGAPAYLVYFDSRSPDGTITLNRDSTNGRGFGIDESMTLELNRLGDGYGRVVVGVAIQQHNGRMVFGDILNPEFRIVEGYTELSAGDFGEVAGSTAATVAEFVRYGGGEWEFHPFVRGFDADPNTFARTMGGAPS
ncbi:TerD family protein [Actinacidiphila sp. ITFR-21]|uniref:TerD family protein n=1 Tax=Actinacidiphila sp. ITFR-21 TaxID=3075199 RepID=UPI00288B9B38|nr:TerD family protein [Streptomyces sp. ITFR-21]WNI19026.1 TerD family protein [Streptomyces sp. ITFR-21]